jgi:hypothetical protein
MSEDTLNLLSYLCNVSVAAGYIAALNTPLRANPTLTRKGLTVSVVGSYSLFIPPVKFKEIINEVVCQSESPKCHLLHPPVD